MSIDYEVYSSCGKGFPDAMDYVHCDKCGSVFCEGCIEELGIERDENFEITNCPVCNGDVIDETDFISWLIDTYCLESKDKIIDLYKKYKNENVE